FVGDVAGLVCCDPLGLLQVWLQPLPAVLRFFAGVLDGPLEFGPERSKFAESPADQILIVILVLLFVGHVAVPRCADAVNHTPAVRSRLACTNWHTALAKQRGASVPASW